MTSQSWRDWDDVDPVKLNLASRQ